MTAQPRPPHPHPPRTRASLLGLVARHQTASVIASAVDFLVMIIWVETGLGSSVSGAAAGAASGAVTNFVIGRRWTFQATGRSAARQAVRYVLVAAGSLGWNSLGQHLMMRSTSLPYVAGRLVVAIVVALAWNFPLQRYFVFPGGRRERQQPA